MRRSLLCLSLITVFASAALADQITLKNGDRLSGAIVSGDGKNPVNQDGVCRRRYHSVGRHRRDRVHAES